MVIKINNLKKKNLICDAVLLQYKLNKFKSFENKNLLLNLDNYKLKKIRKKLINKRKNINILVKNKSKLYLKKNYILKNKNLIFLNNNLIFYWVYNKVFKIIFKLFLLTYVYYIFLVKLLNNLPLNLSNLFINIIFLNNYLKLFKNIMLINKKKELFNFNYNNSCIFPITNKYNKLKRKWLNRYLNILLIKQLKYKISNTVSKYYNKNIIPCIFFLSKKKIILNNTKQILDFIRFTLQRQKKQIFTLRKFFYMQKLNKTREENLSDKIKKKIKYCKNKFNIYFKNKIKVLNLFLNKNNLHKNTFLFENKKSNKYIFNLKNDKKINNFTTIKSIMNNKLNNNSIFHKNIHYKFKKKYKKNIKKKFLYKIKLNFKKNLKKFNLTNLNFKNILNTILKKKNIYFLKYKLSRKKIELNMTLLEKFILKNKKLNFKNKDNFVFEAYNLDKIKIKKKILNLKRNIRLLNLIGKQLFLIYKKCNLFFFNLVKLNNELNLISIIREKKKNENIIVKIKNELNYFNNLTNLELKKSNKKFNKLNSKFVFNNLNLSKLYLIGLNELVNKILFKKKILKLNTNSNFLINSDVLVNNVINKEIFSYIDYYEKYKHFFKKIKRSRKIYRKYKKLIYVSNNKFPLIGIRIELNGNIKKGRRSRKFNYLDLAKIFIRKIPMKDTRYHTEYIQSYARTKKCAIGIKIWIYYKRKIKKLLNIYKKKSMTSFNKYQIQKNKKLLKKNKKK